jgi:hypothetical protein
LPVASVRDVDDRATFPAESTAAADFRCPRDKDCRFKLPCHNDRRFELAVLTTIADSSCGRTTIADSSCGPHNDRRFKRRRTAIADASVVA